jgi:hexosaminidase
MHIRWRPRLLWPAVVTVGVAAAPQDPAQINVVPRPASIEARVDSFVLTAATRIVATDPDSRRIATLFNDALLERHGLRLAIVSAPPQTNYIRLVRTHGGEIPAEGYRLRIDAAGIRITGEAAGLYYGLQTLEQLLPLGMSAAVQVPALDIADQPRFGYRGLLLDVGRHYFSVAFLEKLIDLAAQYKINYFHWHLTDNEGWRIEIRRYPKLTTPAAPYYTQEQIRHLVAYARARFVTIVPEIEMPGHSGAALAAYPELGCEPRERAVAFCPKEETFVFLEHVLDEVIGLFPGLYVHIGSDEVEKDGWRQSSEAQAIIAREGLKDEDGLQSYFARRIERFVASRGKRMIGWDEILQGGLPPRTVVMSWRGEEGGIEAVRQQHEAIMTPSEFCYFDYNQGDARREPPNIGGYIPLEKAYAYEPIPAALAPQDRKFILGAQANLWTEYVSNPEYAEYMLFPRLLAFAEAVWSPAPVRNYADFRRRLPHQLGRLDKQDVRYRIPEPEGLRDGFTTSQDHARVALQPFIPGSRIHYTVDGTDPTDKSPLYEAPLEFELKPERPVALKLVVVTPQDRRSVVYGATYLRRDYREASRADAQPGVAFTLHDGTFASAKDIDRGTRRQSGTMASPALGQFDPVINYAVQFDGFIEAPADDYYRFAVTSDDGALLEIDDEVVVDNDGNHAPILRDGHIPLRRGLHRFRLRYYQATGGVALELQWARADGTLQPIDATAWFH